MKVRLHTLKLLGLLLSAGLGSATAMAQLNLIGVVTETAKASATILNPVGIKETTPINFGNVVSSSATGTVVLTFGGVRTVNGGAGIVTDAGTVSAASFAVTGQNNGTYSVGLPVLATLTATGGLPMEVTNFTSNLIAVNELAGLWRGTLGTDGTGTINVGATLNVGLNQVAGLYEGTYSVLVAYN